MDLLASGVRPYQALLDLQCIARWWMWNKLNKAWRLLVFAATVRNLLNSETNFFARQWKDTLQLSQVADRPPVNWKTFGKPNPEPYELAMTSLRNQAEQLGAFANDTTPANNIYMVGGKLSAWQTTLGYKWSWDPYAVFERVFSPSSNTVQRIATALQSPCSSCLYLLISLLMSAGDIDLVLSAIAKLDCIIWLLSLGWFISHKFSVNIVFLFLYDIPDASLCCTDNPEADMAGAANTGIFSCSFFFLQA